MWALFEKIRMVEKFGDNKDLTKYIKMWGAVVYSS